MPVPKEAWRKEEGDVMALVAMKSGKVLGFQSCVRFPVRLDVKNSLRPSVLPVAT